MSALAITGTMFTLSCSLFINSTSSGFRPCPDGAMKCRQQCTRESGTSVRYTRLSAFRYSSYRDSMYSITGCQLTVQSTDTGTTGHCWYLHTADEYRQSDSSVRSGRAIRPKQIRASAAHKPADHVRAHDSQSRADSRHTQAHVTRRLEGSVAPPQLPPPLTNCCCRPRLQSQACRPP